jgi:hypothetical protein
MLVSEQKFFKRVLSEQQVVICTGGPDTLAMQGWCEQPAVWIAELVVVVPHVKKPLCGFVLCLEKWLVEYVILVCLCTLIHEVVLASGAETLQKRCRGDLEG